MKDLIKKYVLQNSIAFNGKANAGAVLGKILAEHPESKKDIKAIQKQIQTVIKEVAKLPIEIQKEQLQKQAPELLKKKEHKKKELQLPSATKGKVILRFAPSPSGPLHLGHAYVLGLNAELASKYNGKLILRIEDTNPENIYKPAYNLIPEDANWLTKNNISKVIIQSDRLKSYYTHAEQLIQKEAAYICTCDPDTFKQHLTDKEACPCRNELHQENRFKKMFKKYAPGEAVLRLKTDMAHKNPAMRDFAIMRINDHTHPKTKTQYRVWPLMNFSVAIDDHELGITHTLRAKDHRDNEKRQKYIYDYFKWNMPIATYVGRINFTDLRLKTSETKEEILEKKYSGWDDIRLPFLQAMKRRGYQPDAFISYATDVGITENDKKVSKQEFFKALNHFNKTMVDSNANRYFFVSNPKKVTIKGAPEKKVSIALHPNFNARGKRTFETNDSFYIAEDDLNQLTEKKIHRLMDCINFTQKGKSLEYHPGDVDHFRTAKNKGLIMHWLPTTDTINTTVYLEDGTTVTGKGEAAMSKLPEGSLVQLERFGFCRLDKKNKSKLEFWFMHK